MQARFLGSSDVYTCNVSPPGSAKWPCWLSLNSPLLLRPLFSCREASDTVVLKNVILLLV